MKRSHTRRVAYSSGTPMQTMTFVTGLGVLLIAGTAFPAVGLAQNNPPPETDSRGTSLAPPDARPAFPQGRMQAPVGHRQPRVQDLPPSVLRREGGEGGGGLNADQELDRKLGICKGC
jgi:hypothetical protein